MGDIAWIFAQLKDKSVYISESCIYSTNADPTELLHDDGNVSVE